MSFRADGGAEEAGGTPPKGVQRSSAWKQRIFRRLCLAYEWAWRRCRCWCRCWQLAQWFLLSIVGVHFRRSFCLDTGACRGCVGGLGACVCSACGADAFPCWLQAERATIQKTLLHAADISNPCKPWEVSKNWSDRVIEEFFAQGDREKEAGLVVSANMDRETTHPARVAVNFTDFIVAPMFVALTSLLPPAQSCCDLLGESPLLLDARHGRHGSLPCCSGMGTDENRSQWATLLEENIKAQASLSDEARAHQLETLERRSSAFHDVLMTIAHQSSGKTEVEADTAVVNTPKVCLVRRLCTWLCMLTCGPCGVWTQPSRRKVSRRQSLNPLAAFVINAHTTSGLDEPPTPRRQMHQLVAVAEVEVDVDIDS